jgi:hypothetical protein
MSILKEKFGLEIDVVNPLKALRFELLPEEVQKDIRQLYHYSPREFGAYRLQLSLSPGDGLMHSLENGQARLSQIRFVLRLHEETAKARNLAFYNTFLSAENILLKDRFGNRLLSEALPEPSFEFIVLSNRMQLTLWPSFWQSGRQFSPLLILFVAKEVNSRNLENKLVVTALPASDFRQELLNEDQLPDHQRRFLLEEGGLKETIRLTFDTSPLKNYGKMTPEDFTFPNLPDDWKTKIMDLVAKNDLEEATLQVLPKALERGLSSDLTLISSRLNDLKDKSIKGLITTAEADARRNQITKSFLDLLEKL